MFHTKEKATKVFERALDDFISFHGHHSYNLTFKRIDGVEVKSYSTPDNARCHWVAYTDKRNDPKIEIIPCLAYDQEDKQYVVHFINYNPKKKEYYDNSYGSKCVKKIYYLMNNDWINRRYEKNNGILDMNEILRVTKEDVFDIVVPREHWIRKFLDYAEVI